MINSYKDLIVWQKAMHLSEDVYRITQKLPTHELYGLTSQMRRSAISIPSNIAEGRQRGTRKDFAQFLRISLGSVAELETQLVMAHRIYGIEVNQIEQQLTEIGKILNTIIKKLAADS